MRATHTGNEGWRTSTLQPLYGLTIKQTIRQSAITVGASAVKIPSTPLSERLSVTIMNNSSGGQIVYIGDSTVSTTDGFKLLPMAGITLQIQDDVDIYAVASAAGADVRLLEGS